MPDNPPAPAAKGEPYTIRDLATEFGVTARTLRFYEEKGLLQPAREGEGDMAPRLYSRRDRARLRLVLMGKRVGFSLQAVHEMLALYDSHDGDTGQAQRAVAAFQDRINELEARRGEIDRAIEELRHARDVARARAARARGSNGSSATD